MARLCVSGFFFVCLVCVSANKRNTFERASKFDKRRENLLVHTSSGRRMQEKCEKRCSSNRAQTSINPLRFMALAERLRRRTAAASATETMCRTCTQTLDKQRTHAHECWRKFFAQAAHRLLLTGADCRSEEMSATFGTLGTYTNKHTHTHANILCRFSQNAVRWNHTAGR